jgi:hypothetical protein
MLAAETVKSAMAAANQCGGEALSQAKKLAAKIENGERNTERKQLRKRRKQKRGWLASESGSSRKPNG